MLGRELLPLSDLQSFSGAGIYALYYSGDLPIYRKLRDSLKTDSHRPIYVGKAIPKGGRTGGLRTAELRTTALSARLRKHARSIGFVDNLELEDFLVRYLVVDDVWIPLGENMLIESYQPVWNKVVAGFGNNPLGSGRKDQKASLWDILHPGRIEQMNATVQAITQSELERRVELFFAGEPVPETDERDVTDDGNEDDVN